MAVGKVFHYFGSAVLFVAMVLTIVVDISAPVVNDLSFAKVNLRGDATAKFGVFGYCSQGLTGDETCSNSRIGYNPAAVLEDVGSGDIGYTRTESAEALTRALILHPIGTVVLFFTFLLSLVSGSAIVGILATLASGIAFILNTVAVVVDFVIVSLLRNKVRRNGGELDYGVAIWIALVAAALTLLGTILMLVTCCSGRRSRRRHSSKIAANGY